MRGPQVDHTRTHSHAFGAQLGVGLALAIHFIAVVLLALLDHFLPAIGKGALIVLPVALGGGLGRKIHRGGRVIVLRARDTDEGADQERKDEQACRLVRFVGHGEAPLFRGLMVQRGDVAGIAARLLL